MWYILNLIIVENILITSISALSNNRKHDNLYLKLPAGHQLEVTNMISGS